MHDPTTAVSHYFTTRGPAGVVSAYLFGSHARRAAHTESDVDVGVFLDHSTLPDRAERGRLAVSLASDLIGVTHRNEVDVIVLNDAPAGLAAEAIRHGQRLFCANEATDRGLVRTVLLRAADLRPFLDRTRRLKLRSFTQ